MQKYVSVAAVSLQNRQAQLLRQGTQQLPAWLKAAPMAPGLTRLPNSQAEVRARGLGWRRK